MNQQYNTSTFTKTFLQRCFEYLTNIQTDNNNDETQKSFQLIVLLIKVLSNDYKNFTENNSSELFFLITNKCVREVINVEIHKNILLNSPLLDGIATENELDDLFGKILKSISRPEQQHRVKLILDNLSDEIYEILSEYNNISKHIENKNKLDQENALNLVQAKIDSAEQGVINLKEQVSSSLIKFKNSSTITKKKLSLFSQTIKNTEKRMYETNITILSIFSVVALTANTTIGFYTSTISALSTASTYKLVFVLLIVGLICSNTLMILFYYLNKILDNSKEQKRDTDGFSKWSLFLSKLIKPFGSLKPLFISNFVIMFLIIALLCAWNKGHIENRNDRIHKQYYSQVDHLVSNDNSSIDTNSITVENTSLD